MNLVGAPRYTLRARPGSGPCRQCPRGGHVGRGRRRRGHCEAASRPVRKEGFLLGALVDLERRKKRCGRTPPKTPGNRGARVPRGAPWVRGAACTRRRCVLAGALVGAGAPTKAPSASRCRPTRSYHRRAPVHASDHDQWACATGPRIAIGKMGGSCRRKIDLTDPDSALAFPTAAGVTTARLSPVCLTIEIARDLAPAQRPRPRAPCPACSADPCTWR